MITREEAVAPPQLQRADFTYLTDGPRAGETIQAPGHTGKICLGLAANVTPRLGSELIYGPVQGMKTSEGARCYRLAVPNHA